MLKIGGVGLKGRRVHVGVPGHVTKMHLGKGTRRVRVQPHAAVADAGNEASDVARVARDERICE
jgi:hypothetical protein